MTSPLPDADLRALPKAHLHVHLEGAVRVETIADLAGRADVPVPGSGPFAGLAAFVEAYEVGRALVATPEDLSRIARELIEDAAADGFVWSEVHFSPLSYDGRLGAPELLIEAVLQGIDDAADATGAGGALILGHNRARPVPEALQLARLARDYAGRGVVGLGLVGDEARFPPAAFHEAFRAVARDALLRVPHAGETAGPESIRDALEVLGADRIGHGVRCVEDPSLMEHLAEREVCLDVCPTSNVVLGVAPSLDGHPLPRLLDAGIAVSLNSDDPGFFGSSALDEYALVREAFALSAPVVAQIARTSILASAAPESIRVPALATINAWERGGGA